MARRYDSDQDVSMRLGNSIIRYNEEPLYVSEVRDLHVSGNYLKDMSPTGWLDSSSDLLDISSPPLGYAEYATSAAFFSRIPVNRQKQGLSETNLSIYDETRGALPFMLRGTPLGTAIRKVIKGEFVDPKTALTKIFSQASTAVPFCRKFCFVRHTTKPVIFLKHMLRTIGWVDDDRTVWLASSEKDDPAFQKYLQGLLNMPVEYAGVARD